MENLFLKKKTQQGFTLLEVLIVIAIIGILVSIGLASYSQAQIKSRDARRRGDLKSIQNAMEQAYAASSDAKYPNSADCSTLSIGTEYLPAGIPTDPQSGSAYVASTCSASAYCFCAAMESPNSYNSAANCNFSGVKTTYCVGNLQ